MLVTNVFNNSIPAMSETKYRKYCLAIISIALALRTAWAILIPIVPVSDGKAYDILAHNIIQYGVYGWSIDQFSAYWPPGTSAVYAFLYLVFGYGFTPIVVTNIALSTAIVAFTILLGRIFFSNTIALVAGTLMAISPSEVAFVTICASELPFTLLILLGVAAWFSLRLSNLSRAILTGLAFGTATYFRSVSMLLPIALWLASVPNWRKLRAQLPIALLAMIMTVVVIAPWSMRNTKVFGHFVPLSTSDGSNLWIGNNPDATGFFMALPTSTPKLGEYEQNKIFGELAKQNIVAEPVVFVLRVIKKAVLLHAGDTTSVTWNTEAIRDRFGENVLFPFKLLTQGYWTVTLLFALGGIAILIRTHGITKTLTQPTVLIWLYFTAIYSVYFVADRYHFPSRPFISVLAAVAILVCCKRTRLARFFN